MAVEPVAGTVTHGTLRTQDLLRSFSDELDRVSDNDANLTREAREYARRLDEPNPSVETFDYAGDCLSDLQRRLAEIGMEHGLDFCAHEGDGSDFGFWPVDKD